MSHRSRLEIPDSVDTTVRVLEVFSPSTASVSLLNGREVFAYRPPDAIDKPPLEPNQDLPARLFVADFSRAELLG